MSESRPTDTGIASGIAGANPYVIDYLLKEIRTRGRRLDSAELGWLAGVLGQGVGGAVVLQQLQDRLVAEGKVK